MTSFDMNRARALADRVPDFQGEAPPPEPFVALSYIVASDEVIDIDMRAEATRFGLGDGRLVAITDAGVHIEVVFQLDKSWPGQDNKYTVEPIRLRRLRGEVTAMTITPGDKAFEGGRLAADAVILSCVHGDAVCLPLTKKNDAGAYIQSIRAAIGY